VPLGVMGNRRLSFSDWAVPPSLLKKSPMPRTSLQPHLAEVRQLSWAGMCENGTTLSEAVVAVRRVPQAQKLRLCKEKCGSEVEVEVKAQIVVEIKAVAAAEGYVGGRGRKPKRRTTRNKTQFWESTQKQQAESRKEGNSKALSARRIQELRC
jgi:hypothetical protein